MGAEERELRLALGMRGGVSLAVWIGGACVEIDELRRASDEDESGFWTALTTTTGHRRVVVDVMAGASAGGLNGVLFAACQVYGVRFRALRQTWVDVGSTEQLVRTNATESDPSTPADLRWLSLFRGDGHMYRQIVDQLTHLIDDPSAAPPEHTPRLDLRLSATHVEPLLRAVRSPADEPLVERRYGSEFRFVAPAEQWLAGDFPPYAADGADGRPAFLGHLSRLALAARTTSSFPGAFEAAYVRSSRPRTFADPDPAPEGDLDVDMGGILADRRADGAFVLADGGIIDNIPLARAFDAIAAAPASGPTERHLVYLHPGAPSVPAFDDADAPTLQRRRSIVSVLRGAAGSKMASEDISGDIAAIEDHNRAVERAVAVRRATFASLTGRRALLTMAADARSSYLAQRAAEDGRLITDLLDDPMRFLGEDPFPSTVGGRTVPDDRWRSPLGAFSIGDRRGFTTALDRALTERAPDWQLDDPPDAEIYRTGARPLLRTTQILLEWARFVERTAEPSAVAEVGRAKQALYRVLAFVDTCVERPRRLAWAALVATAQSLDGDDGVEALLGRLEGLTRCTPDEAERVTRALLAGDETELIALRKEARQRVDEVTAVSSDGSGPAAGTDLRREIAAQVLVPLAEQIRQASLGGEWAEPSSEPSALLHLVLGGDDPIDATTLAALEVACYGEFASGAPGRRRVDFVRLSAANPTPLAPEFAALAEDAASTDGGPRYWDPAETDWGEQEGIHVELKLAGNELSNFSAFLRTAWRENDWMWGRLDAVPTLVGLIVTPATLRGRSTAELVSEIEAIVTAGGDVAQLGRKIWDERGNEVRAELDAWDAAGRPDEFSLAATRRVLVMRRQWEILAEELGAGDQVAEQVRTYRTGAETIRSPHVYKQIRARLRQIVYAAAKTVPTTADANGFTRWGTGARPTLRGRVLRGGIRASGWIGVRMLTKPTRRAPDRSS